MNIILFTILSVIFILLNVIDIITTEFATKKLDIKERNPVMKWIVHKHFNWAIVIKYFIILNVLYLSFFLLQSYLILIIGIILYSFVALNNILRIRYVRRKLFILSMNA